MAQENPQTQTDLTTETTTFEPTEFDALLTKEFKPKSDQAKTAVQEAVKTLAQQALGSASLISDDVLVTIQSLLGELDRKLAEQVNLIMHHEDFRKMEGTWRGLHHLVSNTETDEMLKIRVMNVSKKELGKTLKKYKGVAWDQSPIFKRVYEDEYGSPGGQPYGCLLGDYYFDHTAPDVELLAGMAQIASAAHAPFISGAAPTVMNMDTWRELSDPRDLTKIFQTPEYAPWRSLRDSEDSRYIGLAMPRFLSRIPYGAKTSPVDDFAFEEDVEGADHNKYVWSNSAYAMGTNITRAFKLYGWCAQIRGTESGGMLEGLPVHTFHRRWRRGHEMPHRNRDHGPARGRVGEKRIYAVVALQRILTTPCLSVPSRSRSRPPIMTRMRRPTRTCRRGYPALICHLSIRSLPQVHGARLRSAPLKMRGHGTLAERRIKNFASTAAQRPETQKAQRPPRTPEVEVAEAEAIPAITLPNSI
jgi:predicted component of type VI protein secretion system